MTYDIFCVVASRKANPQQTGNAGMLNFGTTVIDFVFSIINIFKIELFLAISEKDFY